MVFPNGGPLPRHPSQLYEAGLEGIVLFTILAVMIRIGALKRPGLILGSFIAIYGFARITGEFFREPDPQLGFLWGGLTMGMLLSVPMIIAGAIIIVMAWRRKTPEPILQNPVPRQAVTEYSPLQSEIKKLIKSSGPMPVWRYMELCLTHPEHGYYVSRDPLGREGDFTTAPEVSQMFGELLGLWAASVWKAIGSPPMLRLIELGPGRGTMMADALRALRVLPPLYQSLSVHLVEINPVLREKQKATLSGVRNIAWHDSIDDVPDGPAVIFANEYFDVLPIHQVVKRETGWHERVVELDDNGKLVFGAAAEPTPRFEVLLPPLVRAAPVGAVFEWRPDAEIMKIATPRARPGRRGADHRLRPSAQRRRRYLPGHRPPQLRRSPEKSRPGRRHRPCRFPGAGARRRGSRRARPRPGDAGRISQAARHRDPRGDADGEGHARGFRGHFRRAEAADRRRPRRHGLDVQGAGDLRAASHLARGLRATSSRPPEADTP